MTDPRRESHPDLEVAILRRQTDDHQTALREFRDEIRAAREDVAALRIEIARTRAACAYSGDHSCALRDRVITLETSGRNYWRVAAAIMGSGGLVGIISLIYLMVGRGVS